MMTFGKYEAIKELYQSPFASVFAARLAGSEGDEEARTKAAPYVIKVFDILKAEAHQGQGAQPLRAFTERIRIQKEIADASPTHWATVHASGNADGRPFFVIDHYPRTVQKMVAGRVRLDAWELHELIGAIATGLRELKRVCGRAHGALKTTNVLIGGVGSGGGTKIVLTDPAPGPCIGEEAEAEDMHALGALVYQLVMYRRFTTVAWPVVPSKDWSRLGRRGAQWSRLCTDLLNPDPLKRPTADALVERLHVLTARRLPWRRVAVGLVLLATAATVLHHFQTTARDEAHVACETWLGDLVNDTDRLHRIDEGLTTNPIVLPAESQAVRSFAATDARGSWLNLSDLASSLKTRSAARHIRIRLQAAYEESQHKLEELSVQYKTRGWTQPSDYLHALAVLPAPSDPSALAPAIDQRLARAQLLIRSPAPAPWIDLEKTVATLRSRNDADLAQFADVLRASAMPAIQLTDAGWELKRHLDEADLASRLLRKSESLGDRWPREFDRERLATQESIHFKQPGLEDIRAWLGKVDDYAFADAADLAARDQWARQARTSLAAIEEDIKAAPSEWFSQPAEKSNYQQERDAIDRDLMALRSTIYIRKELPANRYQAQGKGLVARIADLRKYQTDNLSVLALDWRTTNFSSGEVKQFWTGYLDRLNSRLRSLSAADRESARKWTNLLKTLLGDWDRRFKIPEALSTWAWRAAVEEARERQLKSLLGWQPEKPESQPAVEAVNQAASDFQNWCLEARKLAHDFPLDKSVLTAAKVATLREKWSAPSDAAFWNAEVQSTAGQFHEAAKNDLARIDLLTTVTGSRNWKDLQEWARTSSEAELVLAAWHGLQAPSVKAPALWPDTIDDLRAEIDLRTNVLNMVPQATQDDDPVIQSGRAYWTLKNAPAAKPPEILRAASDVQTRFDLAERINPPVIFDLALYRARLAAGGNDTVAVKSAVDALIVANESLTAADKWTVRTLLEQVRQAGVGALKVDANADYLWPSGDPARRLAFRTALLRETQQDVADGDPQSALQRLALADPPDAAMEGKIRALVANAARNRQAGENAYYGNKNFAEAFQFFMEAAKGGDVAAMRNLGGMYRFGNSAIPRDYSQAARWLSRAANLKDIAAMVQLGEMAEAGEGNGKKDFNTALQWYSAAKDDPQAMVHIADMCYAGRGTARDVGAARKWYEAAAARNNLSAMAGLARISIDQGDAREAATWLDAADHNDPGKAMQPLSGLMRELAGLIERNSGAAGARGWYQRAADRHDRVAEEWLKAQAKPVRPPPLIPAPPPPPKQQP